jgi:hypothetical protein
MTVVTVVLMIVRTSEVVNGGVCFSGDVAGKELAHVETYRRSNGAESRSMVVSHKTTVIEKADLLVASL